MGKKRKGEIKNAMYKKGHKQKRKKLSWNLDYLVDEKLSSGNRGPEPGKDWELKKVGMIVNCY